MLARWISVLNTYDYQIEHRPGRKHGNADSLSRKPCSQCKRDECIPPGKPMHVRRLGANGEAEVDENSFVVRVNRISQDALKRLQEDDAWIYRFIALLWSYPERKPAWHDISWESRDVKAMWVQWHSMCRKWFIVPQMAGR